MAWVIYQVVSIGVFLSRFGYVWETKEKSVSVKQFLLVLKNVAQKECMPRYNLPEGN